MRIKELDIRDVGIIQGEKLKNLGNGLIVIGGLNRAGKTTFMNVLRYLGFGFSKGAHIPPPKFQYDVRSRIAVDDNEAYDIILKGFGSPEVKAVNGKAKKSIGEIYNNLDSFTYKQLFTISLDELIKFSGSNGDKMQTVLLGAGLKDMVNIPRIIRELEKEADKIGGRNGNPSVKMFKAYNDNITKGIKLKKEALSQLTSFRENKYKLKQIDDKISCKKSEIKIAENEVIVLEVLKNNYKLYYEMKELKFQCRKYNYEEGEFFKNAEIIGDELLREYKNINKVYVEKEVEFRNNICNNIEFKEKMLEHRFSIEIMKNGLSGLKEKIKNLSLLNDEISTKKRKILSDMKTINGNWTSIQEIYSINVDELDFNLLIELVGNYNDLLQRKKEYSRYVEDLIFEKKSVEEQIKGCKAVKAYSFMKWYFYIMIIFILLGTGTFFLNELLGIAIIISGSIGVGLYLFISFSSNANRINKVKELSIKQEQITFSLEDKNNKLEDILKSLEDADIEFDSYREMLQLDINIQPNGIKEYYRHLKYIKREINEYLIREESIKNLYGEVKEDLNKCSELINIFKDVLNYNNVNITLNNCEKVFSSIERLNEQLQICKELNYIEEKKINLDRRIRNELKIEICTGNYIDSIKKYILKGTEYKKYIEIRQKYELDKQKVMQLLKIERISKAFQELYGEKYSESVESLEVLDYVYSKFVSLDEIKEKYNMIIEDRNKLKKEVEGLEEHRQNLKYQINLLSTDKTLESAHKLIYDGRNSLRPLAEKYASLKTAILILKKIQSNFLEKTKHNLLNKAEDILKNITCGDIKEIKPIDNLAEYDFMTVCRDGRTLDNSSMLSRGTKEQLFLSIRISKIKEIKPSLPVIFDDSFVNFDLKHTRKVVEILSHLSTTHQVFVLTCHSDLVKLISQVNNKAQYWRIEGGSLDLSNSRNLIEFLQS